MTFPCFFLSSLFLEITRQKQQPLLICSTCTLRTYRYIQKVYRAILWTGRSSAHRPIFAFRRYTYYYVDIKGISAEPEQQGGGRKLKVTYLLILPVSEGGRVGEVEVVQKKRRGGKEKSAKKHFWSASKTPPPSLSLCCPKTRCLVDGILTHFAPSLPLSDVSLMLGLFFPPPIPLPGA